MNMMAKAKLIFYAVLVFSIYLFAIFYSFVDHEWNLRDTSIKQTAYSLENTSEGSIRIKLVLLDSSGHAFNNANIKIKKKLPKESERMTRAKTNFKGELELNLEPGRYLFYIENDPIMKKQVHIRAEDNGKSITLRY